MGLMIGVGSTKPTFPYDYYYGIEWDINLSVSAATLYRIGKKVPLSVSDFQSFVVHRVVNVAEAAEILNCSRQNIDYLTRTGKLHPIKSSGKNTLYLKNTFDCALSGPFENLFFTRLSATRALCRSIINVISASQV